jgi:hypothetical protein
MGALVHVVILAWLFLVSLAIDAVENTTWKG